LLLQVLEIGIDPLELFDQLGLEPGIGGRVDASFEPSGLGPAPAAPADFTITFNSHRSPSLT